MLSISRSMMLEVRLEATSNPGLSKLHAVALNTSKSEIPNHLVAEWMHFALF